MNAIQRIVLAFYSLLIVAAAAGVALLTWTGAPWDDQTNGDKLDIEVGDFNLQALVISGDTERIALTALVVAVALFGLLTFILAFARGGSARGGTVRLGQSDGGVVVVPAEALESLLREELVRIPEVRNADARVSVHKNAVESELLLAVDSSANIAHVTNEAAHAVTTALKEQVGVLNVRRPTVKISYDDISVRGRKNKAVAPMAPAPGPGQPYVAPEPVVAAAPPPVEHTAAAETSAPVEFGEAGPRDKRDGDNG